MSAAKKKTDFSIFPPIPYAQIKMCKVGRKRVRTIEEVVLAKFIMEGIDAERMKIALLLVNPSIKSISRRGSILFSVSADDPLMSDARRQKMVYDLIYDQYNTKKKP